MANSAFQALIVAIAIAAICGPATADANRLTLDAALQTTIGENPDLKAARADVEAARGRLVQAGLWPNPRLELAHQTDKPFRNEGDYARSATLRQDFPIGGRIGRQKDVARVDVALALAELNNAERKMIGEVEAEYYSIASVDRKIALIGRLAASADGLDTAIQARHRLGEVSALDANTVSLERQRLQQQRVVLETDRATKLSELAAALGLAPDDELVIDTTPQSPQQPTGLASLEEFALEHRPDFLEARLSVDRAKAERALAGAAAWEDWSVMFGVQESRTVLEQVPVQPRDGALLLSLSVPLPIFNRNQGTRAAAHASQLAAGDRLNALELRIRNEVAARHQETSRLAQAAQSLKEQALPLSARNLEQARTAYNRGQINISDVVQIERQAFDIIMSYEETVARYFQAFAALEAATFSRVDLATHFGTPVDSNHGQGLRH